MKKVGTGTKTPVGGDEDEVMLWLVRRFLGRNVAATSSRSQNCLEKSEMRIISAELHDINSNAAGYGSAAITPDPEPKHATVEALTPRRQRDTLIERRRA